MKKIITIAGSNGKHLINRKLVSFVANQLENIERIDIDLNDFELPIFGVDIEKENGIPNNAVKLNDLFIF